MVISKKKDYKILKVVFLIGFIISINILMVIIKNDNNNYLKENSNLENDSSIKEPNLAIPLNKTTEIFKDKNNQINSDKAILEIPKINLKKELPDKNSIDNNVDKNIYVIKESTFPGSAENSHLILAAHSGYNKISFFQKLPELKNNDLVNLYYNNKKYVYQINNFYEIEKTGQMLFSASSSNDITLITCLKGTNKQIIYKGILISTSNL